MGFVRFLQDAKLEIQPCHLSNKAAHCKPNISVPGVVIAILRH
jgi:hypothetical protein